MADRLPTLWGRWAHPSLPAQHVAECASSARRRAAGIVRVAWVARVALALPLGGGGVAQAQTRDRAAELFDLGVADLKLGKYETACATLESSYGIDGNLGTLIALGDCLERWGKLHSAATRFEALVAALSSPGTAPSAHRAPQLEYAREALVRLTPKIPELQLIYPTPHDPDARVLLDGRRLDPEPPEQEIPVDPGHHVIETRAPDREPWRVELELSAAEHLRVPLELGRAPEAEVLPAADDATITPAAPVASPEPVDIAQPAAPEPDNETNPWRTVGWGLGGLGVVGIGVGTVAGVLVLQECPSFQCPPQAERGERLALLADVGFGVGLAALAGSVVLLLSTDAAPQRDEPAQRVEAATWRPLGGLDARGGWLGVSHDF